MGQRINIVFNSVFTFKLKAHTLQRLRQLTQFAAAQIRQRNRTIGGHGVRVANQLAYGKVNPPYHRSAYQERDPQQRPAGPQNTPLAAFNDRRHGQIGFPDA